MPEATILQHSVAESIQELDEFLVAPVDITDDVERPRILVLDDGIDPLQLDVLRILDDVQSRDPLFLIAFKEFFQGHLELLPLPHEDLYGTGILPDSVSLQAHVQRRVDDQGMHTITPAVCQVDQHLAVLLLEEGGVHGDPTAHRHPALNDLVTSLEGPLRGRLIALIVADEFTTPVRRNGNPLPHLAT